MPERIPVNKDVLRWARETSGMDFETVAQKINRRKVSPAVVEAWETGDAAPSYAQLERLAYEIYKRPLAIFFFPAPPRRRNSEKSFRTLPDTEIAEIQPRLRFLIRSARAMQENLKELYDGANPADVYILRDLPFGADSAAAQMARHVRRYLDISVEEQENLASFDAAFKFWRAHLEEHGVFVFKDAFKHDGFSGFCLYDKKFPLIYVNNSCALSRQIFTLFHELAHLLLGTGGVDTPNDDYISLLRGTDKKIEVLCNEFANALLVPDDDFNIQTRSANADDASIGYLSRRYWVSREVILRKMLDRNTITESTYRATVQRWRQEAAKHQPSGGGNYYSTKRAYLGEKYLAQAFGRYYQDRINFDQLADYLGVKAKNVSGLEALVLSKGSFE